MVRDPESVTDWPRRPIPPPDLAFLSRTWLKEFVTWRHCGPSGFGPGTSSQLLTLLLDKTAFADDEGRQVLTAAATQTVSAMVAVADRLGREGGDLAYSWLTLAALTAVTCCRDGCAPPCSP